MQSRSRLGKAWRAFRGGLLFIPTLLTLGAILLFAVTSLIDIRYGPSLAQFTIESGMWGFVAFAGSTDSAARVLAAITGSWATIAGVVYSVTLVTIQLSATKYSAQVIPVFENDRLNQVTLGAFTATFAYALLVLKTIRGGETPFVPVVGVNLAIILALASLGVLIAFIGNLTAYIRPTRFVEDYAQKGHEELPRLIEPSGKDGYRAAPETRPAEHDGTAIAAAATGYVTKIDWGAIRAFALERRDVQRIDVEVALGAHVGQRTTLVRIGGTQVDERAKEEARSWFELGKTPHANDPDRVAETLADIGVTALSGGATDVGVAKTALRELLDLTAEGLRQEDPGPSFSVGAAHERLVVVARRREAYHRKSFREIRRIMSKTQREGYWDIAQFFALHVGGVISAAAQAERRETWDETTSWLRETFVSILSIGDDRARSGIVENLRERIHEMREQGLQDEATDVEYALLDAAREAEVRQSVQQQLRERDASS